MRNLTLTPDGAWIENLTPTREQSREFITASADRREELAGLLRRPATVEDAAAAQALYDSHRIEGADIIACDIALPEGTGIINCRVDGEHRQIRF